MLVEIKNEVTFWGCFLVAVVTMAHDYTVVSWIFLLAALIVRVDQSARRGILSHILKKAGVDYN